MPRILLNNYTDLDSFEKSLKTILDEMYMLKNRGVTLEQVATFQRRNWIREDIETVFKALREAGITVKWKKEK